MGTTQSAHKRVSASKLDGRKLTANWEVHNNAIWRFGRVFFRCARCARLCTRLYLPLAETGLGCRRCFGLSYASRTLQNYKDSIWGRGFFAKMFRTTQRDWAHMTTDDRRNERCLARLRAEDVYSALIRRAAKGQRFCPGSAGTVTYTGRERGRRTRDGSQVVARRQHVRLHQPVEPRPLRRRYGHTSARRLGRR